MRPALLLRADGGPSIGIGHLMRCVALGERWVARGGRAILVTAGADPGVRDKAAVGGLEVAAVDPAAGGDTEGLGRVAGSLVPGAGSPPWVVLDGYHFPTALHTRLRELGHAVVVIDDQAALPFYDADVVVNPNLGAERRTYPSRPETVQLLGARFCLVRSALAHGAGRATSQPTAARKLLVTMGGADPPNVTERIVRALGRAQDERLRGMEIVIVLGPVNPHAESVSRAVPEGARFRVVRDPRDLPALMRWADLAISAAGGTSWELAAQGVPTLLVRLADNQDAVAEPMRAAGAALDLGRHAGLDDAALVEAVATLAADQGARDALSRNARRLIDGRGAERVLDAMEALRSDRLDAARVSIREATAEDLVPLWRLANDPGVRARSFGRDVIPLEEHRRWLTDQLASDGVVLLVLEAGGALVGQVRYTRREADEAEVHFAIAPAFRGKGAGTLALTETWERASRALGVRRVRGLVMPDNVASLRAFKRAGYREAGRETCRGHPCTAFEFDAAAAPAG